MQKGQVLALVMLSMVVLIAIVGLALDVGTVFIERGRLRRAVDAASIAAALQYRKGYHAADMSNEALEFLRMNGVADITQTHAYVCASIEPVPWNQTDANYNDPSLCPAAGDMPRKLIKVVATADVHLNFLPVIFIDHVKIEADATSEAASLDVMLLIDRSESMTYDAAPGNPQRDPSVCNAGQSGHGYGMVGNCEPFDSIKDAAIQFVHQLNYPFDRVGVVTFDKGAMTNLVLNNDENTIINTIINLSVYPAEGNCDSGGGNPCRYYKEGTYQGFNCPRLYSGDGNIGYCTTTNIGEGLHQAGNELVAPGGDESLRRTQALWVVILLTDGTTNAAYDKDGIPYCPEVTWPYHDPLNPYPGPYCRDKTWSTHHPFGDANYDAEDYAYDQTKYVTFDPNGDQQAYIFTIGLGSLVKQNTNGADSGEPLLQYIADTGKGTYYYAEHGYDVSKIFLDIASNIATRLTQ